MESNSTLHAAASHEKELAWSARSFGCLDMLFQSHPILFTTD